MVNSRHRPAQRAINGANRDRKVTSRFIICRGTLCDMQGGQTSIDISRCLALAQLISLIRLVSSFGTCQGDGHLLSDWRLLISMASLHMTTRTRW